MGNLMDAIRAFDATEANLNKLDRIWEEIKALIPTGLAIAYGSNLATEHADLCRKFEHILNVMPEVGGIKLMNELLDLDTIFQSRLDALEVGEITAEVTVENAIYAQGNSLREYRFHWKAERSALVRSALSDCVSEVDQLLSVLAKEDFQDAARRVTSAEWQQLQNQVAQIEVLRGSTIEAPARWTGLKRHLHYGMSCDLFDIINLDWPSVREGLLERMYGPDDPVPVHASNLSDLVRAAPSGPVVTALKWESLDEEAFERLLFNIVSSAATYSNVQWLTHTNAPDRGRDLSAVRSVDDPLTGTRTYRVVIQCKHWLKSSIGINDATALLAQMDLWEPPKVDELIIATSGRFSSDAVDWIEKHNNKRQAPAIAMWANSHLESLLASRPHLIAQFLLR